MNGKLQVRHFNKGDINLELHHCTWYISSLASVFTPSSLDRLYKMQESNNEVEDIPMQANTLMAFPYASIGGSEENMLSESKAFDESSQYVFPASAYWNLVGSGVDPMQTSSI